MSCASPPPNPSFADVQRTAAQRTGHLVQWDGHTISDQAVAESVQAMLRNALTPEQAVQIALLNNHHLQATFAELGIAQADLVQAGLLRNPVFDLGIRIPTRPPSKTYIDINVAEDFLDVFFIPARKRIAQAQLQTVKSQVTFQVLTLAADTKAAFISYQAFEQQVDLRKSIADATGAAAATAGQLHAAGNNTDLDLANALAQDARARVELESAEADATDARERLNSLMGVWGPRTSWTIANRLPDLPAADMQTTNLESLAIQQRSDLEAARHNIELQSNALGFTAQTRFLTGASIGLDGERETDGQWRIGPSLSLPIPLFDQGQAAMPRAQSALLQSEQQYIAVAVDVRSQVRAAAARMASARVKVEHYRDQVLPFQRQVVEQTQLQYNGMLVGVFALLQARRDQIDVAREYIDALRDYWLARSELERAVGGRLPDAAPAKEVPNHTNGVKP